jgi:hypothetical protein
MKTQEKIEQLAESYLQKNKYNFDNWKEIVHVKQTYIACYTKCQEDMAKEIQSLIDGYKSDILLLEEEFRDSSSVLIVEKMVTLQDVIHDLYKTLNKQD